MKIKSRERELLKSYLGRKKLKLTRQREFILSVFLALEFHVSAEELYKKISRKEPKIGLATIYRTLNLLTGCGLAQKREFGDGQVRYEHIFNHHHHDHLVCNRCRKIIEFKNDTIEKLQREIAKKHKFSVLSHKLEIYGLCSDCAKWLG